MAKKDIESALWGLLCMDADAVKRIADGAPGPKRTAARIALHALRYYETKYEEKNRSPYPNLSPRQFEQRGINLCEQPVGGDIEGFLDNDGNIVRYRKSTNEFAKGHPKEGLMTLFKPKNSAEKGYKYFLKEKESAQRSIRKGKTR